MALLEDIIRWSTELKAWQGDALRRLFLQGGLTAADLNELIAMVKEAQGGGPPTENRPVMLSAEHIPGTGSGASVQIKGLSNLIHINAFPNGRALSFAPSGLTVLFGENGAGKSGYARVLKNTCSARRCDPVQPNAFTGEVGVERIPSADIEILVNGRTKAVAWKQNDSADADLRMVSVYDSACARDYVEMEGEPNFHPYGLGYLNRLVVAQKEMQRILTAERDAITVNGAIFAALKGNTSVGDQIAKIGASTDLNLIRQMATLSEADVQKIAFLDGALRDMDPEPKARALDRLATRLEAAAERAQNAEKFVTDAAVMKLKRLQQSKREADIAYEIAQKQLRGERVAGDFEDLLPGTGNTIWQSLYRAAEAFSTQFAYSDHAFPNTDPGAKCVLCQAELSPGAISRMTRFATFVAEQAATTALDASDTLGKAVKAIIAADLAPLDQPTLDDLANAAPEIHSMAVVSVTAWEKRRHWMVNAVETADWREPEPILAGSGPLDSHLNKLKSRLNDEASTLRKSIDPKLRGEFEAELTELKARQSLGMVISAVEDYVANSIKREALDRCISALGTQGISTKMTSLARTYITTALANAMNQELSALGYKRRVRPTLTGRTDGGTTKMTLQIDGTEMGARQVLSEGEQRAMALGLFLAEATSQDHRSAIVFDDPSTSLDHRHRRHMAVRLVALSEDRQVLIFTHDAVFLTEVLHALRNAERTACLKSIGWDEAAPGHVEDGLTWDTKDTSMRLEELKVLATAIRTASGDYLSEKCAQSITDGYGKLRGTIERAIREVFLNHTVRPFSDEVAVEAFGAVIGHPQDEWDALMDIYERACLATNAHDTPSERQLPIPDADAFLSDISGISELIEKARHRRSAYGKARSARTKARKDVIPSLRA